MSQQKNNNMQKNFYRASAADFGKIPGMPISYWLSKKISKTFDGPSLSELIVTEGQNKTANNDKYVRQFWEVSKSLSGKNSRWLPYAKGGDYRKWFGNIQHVVDWSEEARSHYRKDSSCRLVAETFWYREGITWTDITSTGTGFRFLPEGTTFDMSGPTAFFSDREEIFRCSALLNSTYTKFLLPVLNPTLHAQLRDIKSIPQLELAKNNPRCVEISKMCVDTARTDWDSSEGSLEFAYLPLLNLDYRQPMLKTTYQEVRTHWHEITLEMQRLEEENNRLFIEAYGLADELNPEVPLSEITLTCNPHYRYGGNLSDQERENRLQSDTMAELISYAIGCMMGRYSLDREGLVYAHAANEGFKALVEEGAYATFAADEDGILPLTSDNWFPDDVAARFEAFIRTVWGAETLEDNLQFIADSLCLAAIKPVKKGGETARETIRRYLSAQFFKDHMKTYKKRPIYWLFSSGKEKAFECLVYLHRYNEATLPRMRTEYVTPLLGQMAGRIERLRLQQAEAGTAEAKRIGKEIDTLSKQLTELRAFDDQLKHHADMRITLDLDDGVKVNYSKFGTLLSDVKAITGDKGE
ncbi:MAG: BREX-1 system adenine-specific DNA-methyltransferase PglX [Aeromonadaceae bacterium]|nr:BREX-1 system adenine-specific DNA-methyltransferase PglX [Aeromonadaceae bacterium]